MSRGAFVVNFYEMNTIAEIVTDDSRLIERFFLPQKKMLREGL